MSARLKYYILFASLTSLSCSSALALDGAPPKAPPAASQPAQPKAQPPASQAAAQPSPPQPAPGQTVAPAPSGVNAVTEAAVRMGVLSCAARINQVTNFLGFGAQAEAVMMAPPTQPDHRMTAIALSLPDGSRNAYASVTFAPNQANGCGATYDAIIYWAEKCDAVETHFAGMKRQKTLGKDITVLDGAAATKVFLLPAGAGCVSVKKEVVW
jgi:hypothetical protein